MGKDLKGKELGKGISQESTGLYSARFVDRFGKRKHKRFKKLQECRAWIAAVSYTHLDVYKRQSRYYGKQWFRQIHASQLYCNCDSAYRWKHSGGGRYSCLLYTSRELMEILKNYE